MPRKPKFTPSGATIFSPREIHLSVVCLTLSKALRPTDEYFNRLLRELRDQLPDDLIAALLDASPITVASGELPARYQRPAYLLHRAIIPRDPPETNLFHLATWERLHEPTFQPPRTSLEATILTLLLEEDLLPTRLLLLTQSAHTSIAPGRILTAITEALNAGKIRRTTRGAYAIRRQVAQAMRTFEGRPPKPPKIKPTDTLDTDLVNPPPII